MTFSGFDPGLYRKVSAFFLAPEASANVTTILLEIRLYLRLVTTLSQGSFTFTRQALAGGVVSRMTAFFPFPEKLLFSAATASKIAAAARLAKQVTEAFSALVRLDTLKEALESLPPADCGEWLERQLSFLSSVGQIISKDYLQTYFLSYLYRGYIIMALAISDCKLLPGFFTPSRVASFRQYLNFLERQPHGHFPEFVATVKRSHLWLEDLALGREPRFNEAKPPR